MSEEFKPVCVMGFSKCGCVPCGEWCRTLEDVDRVTKQFQADNLEPRIFESDPPPISWDRKGHSDGLCKNIAVRIKKLENALTQISELVVNGYSGNDCKKIAEEALKY